MLEHIEARLGLHQEVQIWYVVDGYEARLLGADGDTLIVKAKGDTVIEALTKLDEHLKVNP